ncbi:MAG TPA: hypothetical protein VIH93_04980, partial [Thermoanaerobaculia bacterium]
LDRTLSITAQDARMVPIGVRNPLFLPLAFLRPSDQDRCVLCELRLADVAAIASMRGKKVATKAASLAPGEHVALRGGRTYDSSTRFELRLDKSARVTSIRQLTSEGKELDVTELSDYRPVNGAQFDFPRVIDFKRSEPQATAPWLVVRYVIDQLDVNQPIEDSAFVIPYDTVSKVWDSDAAVWRKYRGFNTEGFCKKP